MSGHSKWSSIKRKKGKLDAQRGRVFTRLIKEITVAARLGGGDENANPRLRKAIAEAKANNMPAANIERAIKRGTGELPGVNYEEVIYEGYGPGGAALMVEVVTDNKNRTVADLRHIFSKYGGNLAASGSVAWIFEKKGVIEIRPDVASEDEIMLAAIDAGAEDIKSDEELIEVLTAPEDLDSTKQALTDAGIEIESAQITMYPKNTVKIEGKQAEQLLKLMDALEEHEDVQNIYSNFDIDVKLMEEVG
ncbi:YebC/PmpR family DNA-binding transcriptional regulator [candidate division KSB1 bacterium]|nr:YebC/PmpR family DNA-binding transcriptional regulator [bacterium]RKY74192.1 MAG: YebC/PmpR family DNA-binding transcriptional regulator [candidate division KSB1 bacterium]HDI51444.1 YebC/PmpR family DNA-binding transcriptional regulator [Bacteroidota bacterium]RKY80174.1 MAG: YebC/PmpR family DNA-binding transcriptional regulator [candidate division KSB1 bacterium]RKY86479.1 MAG: YebC/PmpR family DNA-binding transcriptional regulator [candidate division KSB1 bacterium]